jgi:nucleotide sugar dehydrogenase
MINGSKNGVSNMDKISIIGYGPVGQAQHLVFDTVNVIIHDPGLRHNNDWRSSKFIFLCVPTPEGDNGQCDTSILESYLNEPIDCTWIIRSTCPPGFLKTWENKVKLVYMPEFLTERTWRKDALDPIALVLGGRDELTKQVHNLFMQHSVFRDPRYSFTFTTAEYASLLKYTANTWFATKVTLLNYVYDYCHAQNLDYSVLEGLLSEDPRIGPTHLQVPGHDGLRGFGGKCFPKDLRSMIDFFAQAGIDHKLLKQVEQDNLKFRND